MQHDLAQTKDPSMNGSFMISSMKHIRDRVASGCGTLMYHLPLLERSFSACAPLLRGHRRLRTASQLAVDSLSSRLLETRRALRSLSVNSINIQFNVADPTVRYQYFLGLDYEPGTTRFLAESLRENGKFVDIGANHGYFTIMAAKIVGIHGRVSCFEPNPSARHLLEQHVAVNNVQSIVTVCPSALADCGTSEVDFFVGSTVETSVFSSLCPPAFALEHGWLSRENRVSVQTEAFDDWAAKSGLGRQDIVKIDVEGGEHAVLLGMRNTLRNCPPRYIVCETTWDSEAAALVTQFGYKRSWLDTDGQGYGNLLFSHPDCEQ